MLSHVYSLFKFSGDKYVTCPPPYYNYIFFLFCLFVIRLHAAAARFGAVPQKAVWVFECGIPLFFFHSFFHIFIFFGFLFSFLFC